MIALVTGDLGFLGKAICHELEVHGHKTIGFDIADRTSFSVTNAISFDMVMRETNPEVVVHLAAEVGKLNCEINAHRAIDVNAYGTLCVAKVCAERKVPLAYCSTSEVYGDVGAHRICDEDGYWEEIGGSSGRFQMPTGVPSGPLSGTYALTKFWGEQIAQTYAPEGLKIIRPTMPYGTGVPPGLGRRALDNLIWQALTGQPMVVHRGASRSWCWIDDLASGFRAVIEKGESGIYNVGRDDDEVSMEHLAIMILDALHGSVKRPEKDEMSIDERIVRIDPPARQTAVKRISCAKLRALGWEPKTSLDEGLPIMVNWIKSWMADQNKSEQPFVIKRARYEAETRANHHMPFPGCCDAHS